MVQTRWQQKMFAKHGENLLCIDGTHNTTMYENLNLTTLLVRNKRGHGASFPFCHCPPDDTLPGIPISWMLASNGTQRTIEYFLRVHHTQNPLTIPHYIMSDFDRAQINACAAVYATTWILLCWWHVLHAWQQHFKISDHPELWELLKRWNRMTNRTDFDAAWIKIQSIAPESFIEYLRTYWMPQDVVWMWSGVFRTMRNIFEACDTNMLIEASVNSFLSRINFVFRC
jgi:hypothetical protein